MPAGERAVLIAADSTRRFCAIVAADWHERSRSARFLGMLGAVGLLGWWFFPPRNAAYLTVAVDGAHRGLYSSAWIGMVLAMIFSTLLSLAGFYVVRGTLTRDIDTRVWQLLVATPMKRATYLFAKWCSHLLVLGAIVAVALMVGLLAQCVRGEDPRIDLVELVKPTLLLSLPGLAFTAMLAIAFDLVPWLRHTLGNVLYFFVWIGLLSLSIGQALPQHHPTAADRWISDPGGVITFVHAVERQHLQGLSGDRLSNFNILRPVGNDTVQTFSWPAWQVQPGDWRGFAIWLLLTVAGLSLAARMLEWGARQPSSAAIRKGDGSGARMRWLTLLLAPLQRYPGSTLLAVELQSVLRQRRVWWWSLMLACLAVQLFAPLRIAAIAIIAAWTLLLDAMSTAALRERDTRTGALVFSCANATARILRTRCAVLVTLAWLFTLPAILHLAVTMPAAALAVLTVGASLAVWALALGALTLNARSFELLLLVLVYMSLNGLPALNVSVAPWTTLAGHIALLPLAVLALWTAWPRLCRASG